MADIKPTYGAVVSMTVTNLHSLASGNATGWQSVVIDNSTNRYDDALLQLTLVTANSGATANDKGAAIFAYASNDGGTTYTEGASGSEGTFTFATDRLLSFVGFVPMTIINLTYKSRVFSVRDAFGGWLPERYGFVIMNYSGFPLGAAGNLVKYQPVYRSVA